jgi:chemotaxis protein methyltransferase CheR
MNTPTNPTFSTSLAPTIAPIIVPAKNGAFPTALEQVSDVQLSRYADLVYSRTGIRVSPQKKALLSNRLRRRLRSTGILSFEEYYRHLKKLSPKDPEWDAFLQEITTHETYLFRDKAQWDWFREVYLPACGAARAPGKPRTLRIWSAACSTGDEAYTAACCIASSLPECTTWRVRIVGTDIGKGAVEQANTAVFGERAMRQVPDALKRCYFSKAKDAELWQPKPILRDMVSFRQHNLLDPLHEMPFDLVFLKNVLIYFDPASKRQVLENVRSAIRPGGMLIAGTAEGVVDLLRDFQRIESWLLRKPVS